jgi:hypothetical protein
LPSQVIQLAKKKGCPSSGDCAFYIFYADSAFTPTLTGPMQKKNWWPVTSQYERKFFKIALIQTSRKTKGTSADFAVQIRSRATFVS